MTRHQSSRPPRAAFTAAGETTNPGQPCATEGCGHLDVFHDISKTTRQRTACSVSSGPKATPCGCRRFVAAAETLNQENPS